MNRMIPTLIVTTLLTVSSAATLAQSRDYHHGFKHGGAMGLHRVEKMVELTDEQKTALQELRQEFQADRPERLHTRLSGLDPSAEDYQQQVNELAEAAADQARKRVLQQGEMHQRLQAILTDEQKAELKARHQQMMENPMRKNRMRPNNQ